MLLFIIKGLFRDRSRCIFPLIVVSAGIAITVFYTAYLNGFVDGMIRQNAHLDTGHLKVVTRDYAAAITHKPYDLGILDLEEQLAKWKTACPELDWAARISFGALFDVPDSNGMTLSQGEVMGLGIDLLSNDGEIKRVRLNSALKSGTLPKAPGELLVSQSLFDKLHLYLNQQVTLIGSTLYGSLAMQNYRVCGTVSFGVEAMDRGAVIADLSDVRRMLDMENAAGEVLGFFKSGKYDQKAAEKLKLRFNQAFSDSTDEFSPLMLNLTDQNDLGQMLNLMSFSMRIMALVFILLISIILWNSGLMNGIRRYGEFGLRLAMGEEKRHLYLWLVMEAVVIGFVGTLIGTTVGLLVSWYFQVHGFDMSAYAKSSTLMFDNVVRCRINITCYYIGFIPGLLATGLGAMLSGVGIYKRQTS